MKFIGSSDDENELYDLQKDAAEDRNLVREWPAAADRLRSVLEEALPGGDSLGAVEMDVPPMSDEEKSALEALGYF
jgi:hypothetical protein